VHFLRSLVVPVLWFASICSLGQTLPAIYVYQGPGVSQESLQQAVATLQENLGKTYAIQTIGPAAVIQGDWVHQAVLFVMPGGADLPYVKALTGKGNAVIKQYVADGGAYLGLCAGAYYASAQVQFDKGGPLQVLGKRELSFFPGVAIGPAVAPYDYATNSGARAALIQLRDKKQAVPLYFNGGPYFAHATHFKKVQVFGWYVVPGSKPLPAMLLIRYGQGRVVLSGVHFEYDPKRMNPADPNIAKLLPVLETSQNARQQLITSILEWLLIPDKK
jgi:glutamine amidotransferase-like uncharacterized protein